MEYGAIIANWNGSGYIERCLGSVLAAARRSPAPLHLLVVDDASTDDSPQKIATLFPSIQLLRLPVNVGFGQAVNEAMRTLSTPWVFILNNDLALRTDFFERLIETCKSLGGSDLFAIGAKTLQWESHEPNHAGMRARWKERMIVQEGFDTDELTPTDFIQGGSCLVDREKFLALEGFCPIYHPGYWEDYDLAYQARRHGWKNYYEPRAVAYHWGKRSMRALLGDYRLSLTIKRNHLLFNWVNLADKGLLVRHLTGLGGLMLREEPFESESTASWSRAFFSALTKLPSALRFLRTRLPIRDFSGREISTR